RRRTHEHRCADGGLHDVRAALEGTHARGERSGSDGQLCALVRCRARQRASVGKGECRQAPPGPATVAIVWSRKGRCPMTLTSRGFLTGAILIASVAHAQADTAKKPKFNIYGFAEADMGNDFQRINPLFFDRLRVSSLPRTEDEFGKNGQTFFSVRQSRY